MMQFPHNLQFFFIAEMMERVEHGIAGPGNEFHFKDIFPRHRIGILSRFNDLARRIFITQEKMGETAGIIENMDGGFPAAGTKVGQGLPGQ